jgi:hypothetical protein
VNGYLKRDKHAATLCIIAACGVFYFWVSLCWWTHFLTQLSDVVWNFPNELFVDQVVWPVAECVTLLASFVIAFSCSWHRKRGTKFLVVGCVAIANAAFLYDVHFSRAQIHVFGPPGGNNFYATWWLYSSGAHLAPAIRYSIAATSITTVVGVVAFSWRKRKTAVPVETATDER